MARSPHRSIPVPSRSLRRGFCSQDAPPEIAPKSIPTANPDLMFSEITPFFHRALPSPVSVATRRARFRHCCLRRLLSPPRPASVATRRAAAVAHQARRWTAGDDPIR
uniref:Uncharacterized protein n=1 Tax=Setaria viridis TaxID=4556 RepID=A0A4V6D3C7_SETVI|nr:hypothetical protein SEVIR_8G222421v2 [Setaria viridis]